MAEPGASGFLVTEADFEEAKAALARGPEAAAAFLSRSVEARAKQAARRAEPGCTDPQCQGCSNPGCINHVLPDDDDGPIPSDTCPDCAAHYDCGSHVDCGNGRSMRREDGIYELIASGQPPEQGWESVADETVRIEKSAPQYAKGALTRIGPHDFKALRWWDHRHIGRCQGCYLPRIAHPVHGWTKARPLGDTARATLFPDEVPSR